MLTQEGVVGLGMYPTWFLSVCSVFGSVWGFGEFCSFRHIPKEGVIIHLLQSGIVSNQSEPSRGEWGDSTEGVVEWEQSGSSESF